MVSDPVMSPGTCVPSVGRCRAGDDLRHRRGRDAPTVASVRCSSRDVVDAADRPGHPREGQAEPCIRCRRGTSVSVSTPGDRPAVVQLLPPRHPRHHPRHADRAGEQDRPVAATRRRSIAFHMRPRPGAAPKPTRSRPACLAVIDDLLAINALFRLRSARGVLRARRRRTAPDVWKPPTPGHRCRDPSCRTIRGIHRRRRGDRTAARRHRRRRRPGAPARPGRPVRRRHRPANPRSEDVALMTTTSTTTSTSTGTAIAAIYPIPRPAAG